MSVSNTLTLILCGIVIMIIVCIKSYIETRHVFMENASILPIQRVRVIPRQIPISIPNTAIVNTFEESKVPDNNLYNVNV
jgi:hypothetical protein